ncbi:MAG: acetylxylan esterase [Rubrobacteraceae bacterium]
MQRGSGPSPTRPRDFLRFWEKTRTELGLVSPEIEREPEVYGGVAFLRRQGQLPRNTLHPTAQADLHLENISFASLRDARIHGYLLRWDDDEERPLVIHSHGYNSQAEVRWSWAARGINVLGIDVRGFGRSRAALEAPSRWGFMLTGRESPETYVLRGAVCDLMRAVEVGQSILGPRVERLVIHGVSFGGALALMSEAVMQVADFLTVGVPTFGWAEGRHFFVKRGSGSEINDFLDSHPYEAEDLMFVLRYFDTMNFAGLVRCPALVGLGQKDEVVPSPTVYAVANHLGGPHEIMEFPVSHSQAPEQRLWKHFEDNWLTLATEGVPPDFGAPMEAAPDPARG